MSATTQKIMQEIEETKAKCDEQLELGNEEEVTKLKHKVESLNRHLSEANKTLDKSTLLKG